MKSKLYFPILPLTLFFFVFQKTIAQPSDWLWAKSIGGTSDEYCYSVAIDPSGSGDVYTTGSFIGTVDFDPGPGTFNLDGGGIFISKFDGSGNFEWAKAMAGYAAGYSITFDPTGNGSIYTTGFFTGTVDFDPGEGVFNLTAEGQDIFISKLDVAGNFMWAKATSGTGSVNGFSIAADPSGSGGVYTTGYFTGTTDFDPGPGTFNLTSAGVGDIFISKLNSSGNLIWAKAMSGADHDNAHSIVIDPVGAVYLTGFFRGTVDFDPGSGTYNLTSAGEADIFVSKLNSAGNFVWAKKIGAGFGNDDSFHMAVDPAGSGDIYITGQFMGTVDFDPGAGVFNLTSTGGYDIFISKLDGSGNFEWALATGSADSDGGRSIIVDPAGGFIYTTGHFSGTVDFNPDAGVFNLTSAGSYDNFISKWDVSGNFVWAKAVGGTSGEQYSSIGLDASGQVYIAGSFQSNFISFGSTTLANANNSGYTNDIFIARLESNPLQVDLISFHATFNNILGGVDLEWLTASEFNNDYFTIERSSDGITFHQVMQTKGAGNSTSLLHYDVFDPGPDRGKNYYRLRQTDYDGKITYSPIVAVNIIPDTKQLNVYPNPVTNVLTIDLAHGEYSSVEITLSTILGEIVFSSIDQNNSPTTSIDLSDFDAGMYFIELNLDGDRVIHKIWKE